MTSTANNAIKIFLRLALAIGFLSALADRFGLWPEPMSVWGGWDSFVAYTATLLPQFLPQWCVQAAAVLATAAEILFGLALIIGFRVRIVANLSGLLLLIFALSMAFLASVKAPFDNSVVSAAAAAFALGAMRNRCWEIR